MDTNQRSEFENTAQRQAPALRRAARRLAGDARADDLVQETLLRAFQAWDRVDPTSNTRAWLYKILQHTFINEYRRARRETELSIEPVDADRSLDRITSIDLRRALDELPDILRDALVAVDVEGLAYREAADRAGTPIGTIMSRLHRARDRVAGRLAA